MKIQLREWQKQFYYLVKKNKNTLVMGSRGCGKDTIILLLCLEFLMNGEDIAVLNKDQRLNKIFVRKLARMSKEFHLPTEGNVLELRHRKTGAVLTALSGRLDNLQGIHSTIIVNELGGIEGDAEEVIAYAFGSVSSKESSKLIIATNSTEPDTWLHKFWTSKEPRFDNYRDVFAHMNVTIWDVYPRDNLPPDIAAQNAALSPELWGRWYENRFVEVNTPLFSSDMLEKLLPSPPSNLTHSRYAAVDIGTINDPTALVVLGRKGDRWHVVAQERIWGMPLHLQSRWLDEQHKRYRWNKCLIDSGGVGLTVWQTLMDRSWSVRGHWTRKFYEQTTQTLLQRITDGEIHVTPHTPLWNELQRATINETGDLQKTHHKETNGKRSHMDLLDALLGAVSILPSTTQKSPTLSGGHTISSGRGRNGRIQLQL